VRRHGTREQYAGEIKILQIAHGAQELRNTASWPLEVIHAEIKVLQMLQGEQGATYLADQTVDQVVAVLVVVQYEHVTEHELEDMAGLVAAPNTPPPAAVLLSPP
jgi:hypothetical protein